MKKYYPISGMHCHSCELLVEQKISAIEGVRKVNVHHSTGVADVSFNDNATIDDALIHRAIRSAGYQPGHQQPRGWVNTNPNEWIEAFIALSIVFVLYLGVKIFGLSALTASAGTNVGAWIALVIGLTAGVSTCAALVGGLVLGVSARYAESHPSASALERFRPHLFFNIGRIVGFAILGGIIGLAGASLQPSAFVLGALTLLVGLVMISLGLQLTGLFPRVSALLSHRLINSASQAGKRSTGAARQASQ